MNHCHVKKATKSLNSGRGEVASMQVAISPLSTKPSFYLGMLVKIKLSRSEISLSFDGY
jgi:hypothetical protein